MLDEVDFLFGNTTRRLPATIKKHDPDLLLEIEHRTQFLNAFYEQRGGNVPIGARLYCIEHNLNSQPRCQNPNCPNHNPVEWRHATQSFASYCSCSCAQSDPKVKRQIEETNVDRYGTKNVFQAEEIKNRIRNTLQKRYNVDNPSQSPEFQKKKVETFIRHFNATHPLKCKEIKDRIRATNEARYGGPAPMCDKTVQRKMATTCDARYGGIGFASEELAKKSIETTVKIYGKTPIELGHEAAKKITKSKPEIELGNYVATLCNCEIEFNCRTILKDDRELDIYIPSKKLAIEFNGDYWHMNPKHYAESYYNTQAHCTAKQKCEYDRQKQEECQQLGIKLIVVWEHDWMQNQDQVKNMIQKELEVLD